MFPDLEFIKTCLNGLRSQIEKIEQVEKQIKNWVKNWVTSFVRTNRSNWAQNDPNALDYVKGRTHWEEEDIIDISGTSGIITGFTSNILTVTHDEIPFKLGQIWSVQGGIGSAYTNVEVQQGTDGVLYLGTPTATGELPFYITKDTATISGSWQSMMQVASLTLTCTSGSATVHIVHSLNPKFLPSPTSNTVGAIKADSAKTTDIQPVRLGTDGKLYSSGVPIFTTSGTGSAYTANVPEINELVNGMLVVMIPHAASGSTSPTLNINGLGAHQIRRFKSSGSYDSYPGGYTNWLYPGVPVLIVYSSGYWFVCNLTKPDASDLFGQVSALHGGTGRSSLTKGSYLVGNGTGSVLLKTPSEVLADIGAIPTPATASVGQTIVVKAVDESGKPTAWEAVDMPSGSDGERWRLVRTITLEENVTSIDISEDNDGNPFALKKIRIYGNTLGTASGGQLRINVANQTDDHYSILGPYNNFRGLDTTKRCWVAESECVGIIEGKGKWSEWYNTPDTTKLGAAYARAELRNPLLDSGQYLQDRVEFLHIFSNTSEVELASGSYIELWGVDA